MPAKRPRRSAALSGLAAVIAHFFGGARPPQEQTTHLVDPQAAADPAGAAPAHPRGAVPPSLPRTAEERRHDGSA